jgi:hypothetical protein
MIMHKKIEIEIDNLEYIQHLIINIIKVVVYIDIGIRIIQYNIIQNNDKIIYI